jgi:hypothetical protein
MRSSSHSKSSYAEIMQLKHANREQLIRGIREATTEDLEASAQSIKDVMRSSQDPSQRRQRIAPPAFSKCD